MSGLEVCANLVARIPVACHPVCPGDDHVDRAEKNGDSMGFHGKSPRQNGSCWENHNLKVRGNHPLIH